MCSERLSPRRCRPVFQSIAAADHSPQVGLLALRLAELRGLEEGVGKNNTACRAQPVVIDLEDLEASVVREERHDGLHGSATERVVAEIELYKRRFVFERVTDR